MVLQIVQEWRRSVHILIQIETLVLSGIDSHLAKLNILRLRILANIRSSEPKSEV